MNEYKLNGLNANYEKKLEREVIGKLTMTRHSKTNYTEKYPDITPEGKEIADKKGELIASRNQEGKDLEERTYFSSSRPRARSTNEIIKNKFGDQGKPQNISGQIRHMDFNDEEAAMELFHEIRGEKDDPKNVGKVYGTDKRFEESPEIVEPRSKIKKRAMRALEYLIRSFEKNQNEKIPHVIATSHFEVINPIIEDIFEMDDETFGHVEDVEIEFLNSENIEKEVEMKMRFRGQEKKVVFNRDTREIII